MIRNEYKFDLEEKKSYRGWLCYDHEVMMLSSSL